MKKRLSIFYYFFIIIGVVGIVFTLGYDFFRPGEPDFGKNQFMGFIGSIFILLAGIRKLSSTKNNIWNFVIFFIYIAGMFYLVLMPTNYSYQNHPEMLKWGRFYAFDYILNVFGFMPLGYFLMSFFIKFCGKYRLIIRFLVILIIGVLLSLLIEINQYFIPGRSSSLIDVAANGSGNLLGMLLFLLSRSLIKKDS